MSLKMFQTTPDLLPAQLRQEVARVLDAPGGWYWRAARGALPAQVRRAAAPPHQRTATAAMVVAAVGLRALLCTAGASGLLFSNTKPADCQRRIP